VLPILGRRGSWLKVIATELPNGHRGWIPIDSGQLVSDPWSARVDLSAHRVTIMRKARVVRRFTVGVGSPVTPTPVGKFSVTDKLSMSGLTYGCCAMALSGHQPHISQGWKGGDRIALHGTLEQDSIGKSESLGCLRARDRDTSWMVNHVWLGTVVEIRP
jgi:lipoprotein-anchoring transpeptidase ErfK/SrfK